MDLWESLGYLTGLIIGWTLILWTLGKGPTRTPRREAEICEESREGCATCRGAFVLLGWHKVEKEGGMRE